MKTVTHFNKDRDCYDPEEARFYYNKELLLVIKDTGNGYNIGEEVNINGSRYKIYKILQYPEILIVDYYLL